MANGDAMAALGRVPSGLFVLTLGQGESETAMLASWVQQCSFEPPQLSVAVKRGRDVLGQLGPGVVFTLNLLGEGQNALVGRFARGIAPGQPPFDGVEVERPEGAPAVLTDALAYLVCRVNGRHVAGDHEVLFAEVVGGRMLGDGKPWCHVRKSGGNY
jgi:flavin reductase (DIM6/NTAB) family NADH-FMN oxidoreductase RutF